MGFWVNHQNVSFFFNVQGCYLSLDQSNIKCYISGLIKTGFCSVSYRGKLNPHVPTVISLTTYIFQPSRFTSRKVSEMIKFNEDSGVQMPLTRVIWFWSSGPDRHGSLLA